VNTVKIKATGRKRWNI